MACPTGTCGVGLCVHDYPYAKPVPSVGKPPTPPSIKSATATPTPLCSTLARTLIPTVDAIRNLNTTFGMRPYVVTLIKTQWSGGSRGRGVEALISSITLLPTPKISDMGGVSEIVTPVGLDEFGSISVSEVSGSYTEDFLRGSDTEGRPPAIDEQFYYEIEFPPSCTGGNGERRRFSISSAPMYFPDKFGWVLHLERARADRTRQGEVR